MESKHKMYRDNEYFIMNEIMEDENITQRGLSRKLGLSLGTVNVLINKMVKEGLIKMDQVSQKQVMYMLTPKGIVEKGKKTVKYLKGHYRAIYETKERIKEIFDELSLRYDNIMIVKSDDEIGHIVGIALEEYKQGKNYGKLKILKNSDEILEYRELENTVFVYGSFEDKRVNGELEGIGEDRVWLVEML